MAVKSFESMKEKQFYFLVEVVKNVCKDDKSVQQAGWEFGAAEDFNFFKVEIEDGIVLVCTALLERVLESLGRVDVLNPNLSKEVEKHISANYGLRIGMEKMKIGDEEFDFLFLQNC